MRAASFVITCFLIAGAYAREASVEGFTPDPKIKEISQAYALDAVDIAERNFGIKLDWSTESIKQVEAILGQLHDAQKQEKPAEQTITTFSKAFGSYVGEVIIKKHGGTWGMLAEYPALSHGVWPWARAHKRIMNGPEDNIWHYYVVFFEKKQ